MYRVSATNPTTGPGNIFDRRDIGPFSSRAAAEQAAIRLADDPRRYGRIEIEQSDEEEDE